MPSAVTDLYRAFRLGSVRPCEGHLEPTPGTHGGQERVLAPGTYRRPGSRTMGAPADASRPPRTDKGTPRMSRRPSDLPPGRNPQKGGPTPPPSPTRWLPWLIIGVLLVGGLFFFNFGRTSTPKADLSYTQFQKAVDNGTVKSVEFDPESGKITGTFKTAQGGKTQFTSSGPNNDFQATEIAQLQEKGVNFKYVRAGSDILGTILIWVIPFALLIGIFIWIN